MRAEKIQRVFAWRPRLRAAAVALQTAACANVVALVPALLVEAPLGLVVRRLFLFSLLPALGFLVLRALATAGARLDSGRLLLLFRASGERIELPLASVAGVRRFRLPLPHPGFCIELRSGVDFAHSLSQPDPSALAAQLDPSANFRDTATRLRWLHHPLLKFGLFGGAVAFVLFRLHQLITYGGLLGEWQQLGARHWFQTLLGVALYVLSRLLAWAVCLRVAVELLALWRNRVWRIALEGAAAVAFYGVTAAVLIARLVLG